MASSTIIEAIERAEMLSQYTKTTPVILQTLKTLISWSASAILNLSDDVVIEHPDLLDGWYMGATYSKGARVSCGAAVFKCLADHTSDNASCPLDDDEHWLRLTPKPEDAIDKEIAESETKENE